MTTISYAIIALLGIIFAVLLTRGERAWLSFTFIGIVAILGLYVYDLARIPPDLRWIFVDALAYEKLLILSLGFVLFFGVGEFIGYSIGYRKPVSIAHVHYRHSWVQVAIVLFTIGLAGQIVFLQSSGGFMSVYGTAHGGGGNYASAYIYRLYHSIFTAAVIFMAFAVRGKPLGKVGRLVMAIAIVALFFDLFTQGKRGGVIRFMLMIAVPLIVLDALTLKRRVLLIGGLIAAMAFILVLPYIRVALSISSINGLAQVVSELSQMTDTYTDAYTVRTEGKHVIFASIVTAGALEIVQHNYGTRWLFPFINLVPRAMWPDKPFRYDFAQDFYDISEASSSINIPRGSYPGGVPESFAEWWIFVVVIWFLMGLAAGLVRGQAHAKKTILSITLFYAMAVFFVHFILQDTVQGILSFIFLLGPFMVLMVIFKALPRRRRRARDRPVPQPARKSSDLARKQAQLRAHSVE